MEKKPDYVDFSSMWDRFRHMNTPLVINQKLITEEYCEHNHFHDFPQLWYCAEGEYVHTVGGESFDCTAGSLIVVPPGVPHHFEVSADSSCELYQTNLIFNLFRNFSEIAELQCAAYTFLPAFSRELRFALSFKYVFSGEEMETATAIFRRLSGKDAIKPPQNATAFNNLFFSVFALSPFSLPEKIRARAEKFIREKFIPLLRTVYYMNINFGNKIVREELVELSGLCQTDYFRYIKRITGVTFSTYLQRLRVRHAIVLATFSPYSLSYIADICGFGDLSYMENRIKKYTSRNHLPRDMRRERKKYIKTFPLMIMTRDDYEAIPKFFYEL